jgi:hypothetical protein
LGCNGTQAIVEKLNGCSKVIDELLYCVRDNSCYRIGDCVVLLRQPPHVPKKRQLLAGGQWLKERLEMLQEAETDTMNAIARCKI